MKWNIHAIALLVIFCEIGSDAIGQSAETYTVPDFYNPKDVKVKDTTYRFECYDKRDKLIPKVTDFDQVFYYSLFQEYIDVSHTYTDAKGQKQPLPVSKIVKRFDKTGKDRWMCITYPGNRLIELKEYKPDITKIDTLTAGNKKTVYRYYKTVVEN